MAKILFNITNGTEPKKPMDLCSRTAVEEGHDYSFLKC